MGDKPTNFELCLHCFTSRAAAMAIPLQTFLGLNVHVLDLTLVVLANATHARTLQEPNLVHINIL